MNQCSDRRKEGDERKNHRMKSAQKNERDAMGKGRMKADERSKINGTGTRAGLADATDGTVARVAEKAHGREWA